MPLRLNLRPYEQIMINGAVITNIRRRSFLAIHNHARIIPGKFILKDENAITPVRRVYFAAQMAYIYCEDPDQLDAWVADFDQRLEEVLGILSNDEMRVRLTEVAEAFDTVLSTSVIGFYSPREDRIVVVSDAETPRLDRATLAHELVHALQHLSFFGAALLFWWVVVRSGRSAAGHGAAVIGVFTTAVHSTALGAFLTFAPTVWYPVYFERTAAWGLSPLEDQQLGGLIMWVPAGIVYVIAAVVLVARWLQASELRVQRRERQGWAGSR